MASPGQALQGERQAGAWAGAGCGGRAGNRQKGKPQGGSHISAATTTRQPCHFCTLFSHLCTSMHSAPHWVQDSVSGAHHAAGAAAPLGAAALFPPAQAPARPGCRAGGGGGGTDSRAGAAGEATQQAGTALRFLLLVGQCDVNHWLPRTGACIGSCHRLHACCRRRWRRALRHPLQGPEAAVAAAAQAVGAAAGTRVGRAMTALLSWTLSCTTSEWCITSGMLAYRAVVCCCALL